MDLTLRTLLTLLTRTCLVQQWCWKAQPSKWSDDRRYIFATWFCIIVQIVQAILIFGCFNMIQLCMSVWIFIPGDRLLLNCWFVLLHSTQVTTKKNMNQPWLMRHDVVLWGWTWANKIMSAESPVIFCTSLALEKRGFPQVFSIQPWTSKEIEFIGWFLGRIFSHWMVFSFQIHPGW